MMLWLCGIMRRIEYLTSFLTPLLMGTHMKSLLFAYLFSVLQYLRRYRYYFMKITICILFILVSSLSYSETFDVYDACIVKHESLILEVREIGSQFINNNDF